MPRSTVFKNFQELVTLDDETLTTIIDIPTADLEGIFVEVSVTNTALDQFVVQARPSYQGSFNTILSQATDFTTASDIMIKASGDLTALSANTTGWFLLYPKGIESIRIKAARAAGSDAQVTITVGGS